MTWDISFISDNPFMEEVTALICQGGISIFP